MSQPAIYQLGSRVYCSDADCGELLQVVVEPDLPRLADLVVCSVLDDAARLVGPDLARPTPHGILLDCDHDAYRRLPATPLRCPSRPAATQALGDAGTISDAGTFSETQIRIRRGDHVRALDGDAGRVLGLIVRPEDAAITHVLLTTGHLWHRTHVAVPVDFVAGLGFAGLDVLLTKDSFTDFAAR